VVLQAVETGVVSVAPPQLDGHAAVGVGGKLSGDGQLLQLRLGGDVVHPIGHGGHRLQGVGQGGGVIASQHLAVGGKGGVKD